MVDAQPEFETSDNVGTTDEFTGTVGVSPIQIPSVAGNDIEEISIRCRVDQPNNRRLEFSFDGVNYFRLKVGEAREEEPRGGIKQVFIRAAGSGASSCLYEIIMNRGQP